MPAGVSAYVPLANVTLSSSAASVTFSSISQAYRDLVLVVNGITASAAIPTIRINGDSGSNYSFVQMLGDGSTASSTNSTAFEIKLLQSASTTPGNWIVNFMDYSATDKHKTVLVRGDRADSGTRAVANRWASTTAMNSFVINDVTWAAGSTFALYGVSA